MRSAEIHPGIALLKVMDVILADVRAEIAQAMNAATKEAVESLATAASAQIEEIKGFMEENAARLRGKDGDDADPVDEDAIAKRVKKEVQGEIRIPEDGRTPEKSKDYWTPGEVEAMKKEVLAIVTPKKGEDYWTEDEIKAVIQAVYDMIELPDSQQLEPGKDYPTHDQIRKLIIESMPKVPGLEEIISSLLPALTAHIDARVKSSGKVKKGKYMHGGGDTVKGGTGISITINADGTKTISSTGGGFSTLLATETPDGSNKVFTFMAATAEPTFIIGDNVMQRPVSASGGVNWTWNIATKQATMTVPPQDDIVGVI